MTTSIGPALSLAAMKSAQMAGLYLGSKVLSWSCQDAAEFLQKYCNSSTDSIACMSMKGQEITGCMGSWMLSGGIVYDGIDFVFQVKAGK